MHGIINRIGNEVGPIAVMVANWGFILLAGGLVMFHHELGLIFTCGCIYGVAFLISVTVKAHKLMVNTTEVSRIFPASLKNCNNSLRRKLNERIAISCRPFYWNCGFFGCVDRGFFLDILNKVTINWLINLMVYFMGRSRIQARNMDVSFENS